jgi:hypothetical protein
MRLKTPWHNRREQQVWHLNDRAHAAPVRRRVSPTRALNIALCQGWSTWALGIRIEHWEFE